MREGNNVVQARFIFNVAQPQPRIVPTGVVRASAGPDKIMASAICWRLLSPNNRQLGRSANLYDDLAACQRAVNEFVAQLTEAELSVACETRPVRWTWRVLVRDQVVAMSGRSFETERQAARTLDIFLATARVATVVPELVGHPVVRPDPLVDTPIQLTERRRVR